MDNLGSRIKSRREALGITQAQLALIVGVSAPAVTQWERGVTEPRGRRLQALADALQIAPDLLTREIPQKVKPVEIALESVMKPEPSPTTPSFTVDPESLPLREAITFPHEEGGFLLKDAIIDTVRRPVALVNVAESYGLYLPEDTMEPRWMKGDLLLVHPKRPPRIGDHVLLSVEPVQGGPIISYCKRLLRQQGGVVEVEHYNPRRSSLFPENQIRALHRILDWEDAFSL